MDYPHPYVTLKNGQVDLSDAYAKGIVEYEKASIVWGYQDFPKSKDEKIELEKIVQDLFASKMQFLTDQDARPNGSVHPETHLWDNGANATEELTRLIALRKHVLDNFDEKKLQKNQPMATLEEVFVPMYMFHRFQVQASAKSLGGAFYTNALKGDQQEIFKPVNAANQRKSLDALLETLQPAFLAVPKQVLALIPPRPFRYPANPKETFKRYTGMSFDILSPAESSAELSLSLMLEPSRASRLATQQVFDTSLPSFTEVLSKMTKTLVQSPDLTKNDYTGQLKRVVAEMYVRALKLLSENEKANLEAKSNVLTELKSLTAYVAKHQIALGGFGIYLDHVLKSEDIIESSKAYFVAPDGQPIDQDYEWLECRN